MITNMCLIIFFNVYYNDKYMGFRSSSVKRRPDCSLTVLVLVDSVVFTGFIQRRRCLVLLWRRRGYELIFCGGLC